MQRRTALRIGLAALGLAGAVALVAVLVFGAGAVLRELGLRVGDDPTEEALRGRGGLLVVGGPRFGGFGAEGTRELRPASVPGAVEALSGTSPEALTRAMDAAGVGAVLVEPARAEGARGADATLEGRLRQLDYVEGLRGEWLSPDAAVYLRAHEVEVGNDPELLALLARGMLEGRPPPPLAVFPRSLRQIGSVEVMVLLRQNGQARLWRSARDSSVAKALITAATVARERWHERESAMGGSLERLLPRLDVEVALLEEDGTLGSTRPDFLERAITLEHGVGYEQRGAHRAWRYLLPEATAREGHGSAVAAFEALFRDNDLPPDSFERPDLRLYRLVVRSLGRSAGSPAASAVGPLPEPGEPSRASRSDRGAAAH